MQLIKIGKFEVNPDTIQFIDHKQEGYYIVFNREVIHVANDTDEYLDLSVFITLARKKVQNEEKETTIESNEDISSDADKDV